MLTKLLGKIFGDKQKKNIKKLRPYVDVINGEFEKLADLSEEELRSRTDLFRRRLARGEMPSSRRRPSARWALSG